VLEEALRETVRRLAVRRSSHRATALAADVCLAQNSSTARRLPDDRVVVLPNALTVQLPHVGPAEPRNGDIAFVGRLVPWKGAHLAVRALQYVRHEAAVLRIFGSGPDEQRVRRAAERWGLEARVELVGSLPREALLRQLRRCGVLLHPALHDESPIALGEALSLGVPVVCLDHGGPAEVVRWWPSSPARLVPPSGPDATARRLAAAVDEFLAHPPVSPTEPVPAAASFESLLLDAYDEAVARAGSSRVRA
jgi:glycosyltransferase involved in cell wall biosynthesis